MNTFGPRTKPLLAAFATLFFWAFAFPASKAVLVWFTVEQIVLLRHIAACGFYLLLFAFGRFSLPRRSDCAVILLLGICGVTIYQLLFVRGVGAVAAGAAAMMIAANPVFASILARIFLREKLSTGAHLGIAVSLGGVAAITFGKGFGGEFVGYVLLVIATFSIACYFVFQKPLSARGYSPLAITANTCIAGTLPLLIFLPQAVDAAQQAPLNALLLIGAMGVLSSGVGFVLWFYALSKLPAGVVTSFLFLQPVLVTVISWFWLREIPSTLAFIGGAVVLLGVGLILRPQLRLRVKSKP